MWSINNSTKGALLLEHWKRTEEIQANLLHNNENSDKDHLCNHANLLNHTLVKSSDEIVLGSYLPQNTSGVRIPFFASQKLPEKENQERTTEKLKNPTVPINIPFPKRMADFLAQSPVFLQDSSEYNPNIVATSNQWQIAVYLEGIPVDPTEVLEFQQFSWARDKSTHWILRTFSSNEMDNILRDINSVSGFSDEIFRDFERPSSAHSRDFLFVE